MSSGNISGNLRNIRPGCCFEKDAGTCEEPSTLGVPRVELNPHVFGQPAILNVSLMPRKPAIPATILAAGCPSP